MWHTTNRYYIQNQVYSIMLLVFCGILFHLSSILFYFTYWRIVQFILLCFIYIFHSVLCYSTYIVYFCIYPLHIMYLESRDWSNPCSCQATDTSWWTSVCRSKLLATVNLSSPRSRLTWVGQASHWQVWWTHSLLKKHRSKGETSLNIFIYHLFSILFCLLRQLQ